MCDEYPCKKYEGADLHDSFVTHKNQFCDIEKARNDISIYQAELDNKIQMLEELLTNYNDGRRKGFFCLAVNLLDLLEINSIMEQLKSETMPNADVKEKAANAVGLFQAIADVKGIVLKLRK